MLLTGQVRAGGQLSFLLDRMISLLVDMIFLLYLG
jgi:hypothetical protein